MIDLALNPDCKSQILIQMTAESELGEVLMILGFDAKAIFVKFTNGGLSFFLFHFPFSFSFLIFLFLEHRVRVRSQDTENEVEGSRTNNVI